MATGHGILTIFCSAFFAVLFLQSGFDKIIDWKGNKEFHTSKFEHTLLKNYSVYTLVIIMVSEICCGLLSVAGLVSCLLSHDRQLSHYADCLACAIIICLFFGLRISKDYRGAAGVVPYFIASIIAIYFSYLNYDNSLFRWQFSTWSFGSLK